MRARHLLLFWRPAVLLAALCLSLAVWWQHDTQASRCGACVLLVALLWATEAIPLEVTSFLPVVLLPLLGILGTGDVSKEYFNGANMMFLTAMGMAAAVQASGLHRRLALSILMVTGTGKRSLLLSFMCITCGVSMFICNTATCAMMCPILKVVLEQVYREEREEGVGGDTEILIRKLTKEQSRRSREKVMFYLGVAYAANIGGTGTLTASEPNVIMKGILDEMYPCQDRLTYATWLLYSLPTILILLTVAFFWLMLLFLRTTKEEGHSGKELRRFLQQQHESLGPVTTREVLVAAYFTLLVVLWFFQEPEFIPGWSDLFAPGVGEATPAALVLILLFITPSNFNFWPFRARSGPWEAVVLPPTLLDWDTMAKFFPWGLLLLRGGGFALAAGSDKSGLSHWIGSSLSSLSSLPPWGVVAMSCAITSIVTEVCSNAATANILLPVLGDLAVQLKLNPLYLMLPATVTCCYAFMLPVSCPPNAIVYKASGMKSWQMMMAGAGLNLVTLVVSVTAASTYGGPLLGMDSFPSWANMTTCPE